MLECIEIQRGERMQDYITLKKYLKQYKTCRIRLRQLKERQRNISQDIKPEDAAKLKENIAQHEQAVVDLAQDISSVISLLPPGSVERCVLEYRYIDCWSWAKIETQSGLYLQRAQLCRYEGKGLRRLLQMPKVTETIKEYKNHS
jgi:hypothetical protein